MFGLRKRTSRRKATVFLLASTIAISEWHSQHPQPTKRISIQVRIMSGPEQAVWLTTTPILPTLSLAAAVYA